MQFIARATQEYPENGVYIHGLFIDGCDWQRKRDDGSNAGPYTVGDRKKTICCGHLRPARLKHLMPAVPVMYIRAVRVNPQWTPTSVGYLRGDPRIYECPLYHTPQRGETYVILATLRSKEPVERWVLAGAALLMQTDS